MTTIRQAPLHHDRGDPLPPPSLLDGQNDKKRYCFLQLSGLHQNQIQTHVHLVGELPRPGPHVRRLQEFALNHHPHRYPVLRLESYQPPVCYGVLGCQVAVHETVGISHLLCHGATSIFLFPCMYVIYYTFVASLSQVWTYVYIDGTNSQLTRC